MGAGMKYITCCNIWVSLDEAYSHNCGKNLWSFNPELCEFKVEFSDQEGYDIWLYVCDKKSKIVETLYDVEEAFFIADEMNRLNKLKVEGGKDGGA